MDMITQAINEAGHELRSFPMGRWCAPFTMKRCAIAEEERGR
jgi:hypothetical protein